MVSRIRTHMMFFTCEFSVRKGKERRKVSITNKINVTTWGRRGRKEIDWFEGNPTFSNGLRAFLGPYFILRLLDLFR